MKRAALITLLVLSLVTALSENACSETGGGIRSWVCFYGPSFPAVKVPSYDLYVFSNTYHPEIAPLQKRGSKVVGYVSVGEIRSDEVAFPAIKEAGAIVEENKNWPGAFRVDMGKPKWVEYVTETLVPKVLAEGFDGIFIDTIDTAWYLEHEKKIKGSIDGAVSLIKAIRKKYPDKMIVLNNGLFMLNDVGAYVDAVVVESVFTAYDFAKKQYQLAKPEATKDRLSYLTQFRAELKKPVLVLDYLSPVDKKMIKQVTAEAEKEGLIPYIAEIGLNSIFYHP